MAGQLQSRPHVADDLDGRGVRVAIACGRFNDVITQRLLDGARRGLRRAGVLDDDVCVEWVPGAFELPFAARTLARSGRFDAVLTLGAVIRGETTHYEIVSGESARGCQDVQLATGIPVVFGVLTCNDDDQALARSEPDGHNVGEEGALTAVEMACLSRRYPPSAEV